MSNTENRSRMATRILWALLLIGLLGVAGQLIYVQIIKGPELEAQGRSVRMHEAITRRGGIVDTNAT